MIKITQEYEMIKKMLLDDKELFDRISDDHTDIEKWSPENSWWLGWFENGECLALLSVTEENAIVLNIHMHIPKKNRGKNSFKMGNGLIQFLCKECDKRFIKLNAKVPVIYPDVVRFSEKCGFKKEGIDSHSYIKNGEIFDRIMFGKVIR